MPKREGNEGSGPRPAIALGYDEEVVVVGRTEADVEGETSPFDGSEISDAEIEGVLSALGGKAAATMTGSVTVLTDDRDDDPSLSGDFHSVYMPSGIGSLSGDDSFDIPAEETPADDSLVLESFEIDGRGDMDVVEAAVSTLTTGVGVVIDPEVKDRVLAICRSDEPRNLALVAETISKIADRDVVLTILANPAVGVEVKNAILAKNRTANDELIDEIAATTEDREMITLILERGIKNISTLMALLVNSFFLGDESQATNRQFVETKYGKPLKDGQTIVDVLEVLTERRTIEKIKALCADKGFYRLGDGLAIFHVKDGHLYMSMPLIEEPLVLDSDLDSGLLLEHLQRLTFRSAGSPIKHLKQNMVQIFGALNDF